jgi:hypothetical protein
MGGVEDWECLVVKYSCYKKLHAAKISSYCVVYQLFHPCYNNGKTFLAGN